MSMSNTNEQVITLRPESTETLAVQAPQMSAAMTILRMAADSTVDITRIQQLMVIAKELDAEDSRKQYHAAVAAFKAHDIHVIKDKENVQFSKGGKKSMYVSLGNLVQTVTPFMAQHGLSVAWDIDQSAVKQIKITCTLTHAAGHSESVSMTAPPDESGAKNNIQQIKSTRTYLQACTFESICGLASTDANEDDDGNSSTNGSLAVACREIETADTLEECTALYRKAFAEAKEAKNNTALNALIASKEAWKKKHQTAQPPAEQPKAAATPLQQSNARQQPAQTGKPDAPAIASCTYDVRDDGTMEITCKILDVRGKDDVKDKAGKVTEKGYLRLQINAPQTEAQFVTVWHKSLWPLLATIQKVRCPIPAVLIVKVSGAYLNLEDVEELDGQRFRDGKPIESTPIDNRDIPEGLGESTRQRETVTAITGIDDVLF